MWKSTYNKFFKGLDKGAVWRIWSDVNSWAAWHDDLDYCRMEGAFERGNHFMLKPKGVGVVKIVLTDVQDGIGFTDCTTFFGAKMFDMHLMEERDGGVLLSNTVIVTGPLRWLWVKLVAQGVADSVPHQIDALAERARGLK